MVDCEDHKHLTGTNCNSRFEQSLKPMKLIENVRGNIDNLNDDVNAALDEMQRKIITYMGHQHR